MGAPSRSFFIEDGVFQADHCPLLLFNIEIDYFCYSIKIVFNVMNSISLAMIQNGHRAINVTNTYCLQVFDWNNNAHFRVLINMFIYKLIHCAWPSKQHMASHINSGLARDPHTCTLPWSNGCGVSTRIIQMNSPSLALRVTASIHNSSTVSTSLGGILPWPYYCSPVVRIES